MVCPAVLLYRKWRLLCDAGEGDVLSLHFPTEDERDCYIISAQGASSESLYNQISSAAADSQTSSPGSGVRTSCKGGIDCWERASVVMWRKQPPNAVRER